MDNTALALKNDVCAIWQDTEKIRQLFAPTLTEKEFSFFVSLGVGLQANPFTREIWAVKYDKDKPASVFLGRDFYRKKAQEQPDYDGHVAQAVYENDDFEVVDGIPHHKFKLTNRGKLLGAYGALYRKNISKPFFKFVELAEYDKGFALWKSMKVMLIEKVAEAQVLRGGYQGLFKGTYDESEEAAVTWNAPPEMPKSKKPEVRPPQAKQPEAPDMPPPDAPPCDTISDKQVKLIWAKLKAKGVPEETFKDFMVENLGVEHTKDIFKAQMDDVLEYIEQYQAA